ncbi:MULTISPECIES: DoxX family membrane protein [Glutamicibacter]|uniref:DoxX-like protein n=2 Tax=Glutamicibacter TaxID=1742989 RepID=A0ABX4MZD4_9MICC|nr:MULTISPECIES: DoxX family membrane protein [Glutamicibacter]MDV2981469.1 DoxX family membrane protein [Actinomycetes bacterium ARC8]PJJ44752.1 DoxX-like protein [Glutamicibacter mysorens]QEP08080.1 DoxX family membrane protein [Glutamicibacter sp. ZJUTW]RWZ82330.1 DoxX family membrane protein [Glutamicibacter sp. HZAU]WIV43291.1 DoxX family membrane protein [Glutamicibacter nicotianae]
MGISIANAALRLVSGAFILNSGINKLRIDEASAAGLQQMAANGVPQLAELEPAVFGKAVSISEISLGSALLLPLIPSRLAGLGLGAFSGVLLASYLRTPGMTESDGIRPTADGTALAKDVWLAGIAVALIFGRKAAKKIKKAK